MQGQTSGLNLFQHGKTWNRNKTLNLWVLKGKTQVNLSKKYILGTR